MVVEPSAYHRLQPGALFLDRAMHHAGQPEFDLLQRRSQTFRNALPFDAEASVSEFPTVMRETQEVESLGSSLAPPLAITFGVSAELDQAGFLGVQRQTKLLQPRAKLAEQSQGIPASLESQHEVVGIADHDHVASRLTLSPLVHPKVEHVVQVDIGQQRRNRSSNDIANSGGLLDRLIPRERLRTAYGEGWKSP